MSNIMTSLVQVQTSMAAQGATIMTVLGVLFAISKAVSTEKAPIIVGKIQLFFDTLAKVLAKAGEVVQSLANALASLVQSDGVLGKK